MGIASPPAAMSTAAVQPELLTVEAFVRQVVAPYERDARCGAHGPSAELVAELRGLARAAGLDGRPH
jgi:acyl-CoA dehydrogenase